MLCRNLVGNGSSPLVRGSVTRPLRRRLHSRFIPARAGIGLAAQPGMKSHAVHPRSCGDRVKAVLLLRHKGGSSPLVRGSVTAQCPKYPIDRFIPARAGIGADAASSASCSAVHPRSCGDRVFPLQATGNTIGSSPLVRGSERTQAIVASSPRFIPARAGIGTWLNNAPPMTSVHPRSCGDRGECQGLVKWYCGSSPLVRGSDGHHPCEADCRRFIPARAGIGSPAFE